MPRLRVLYLIEEYYKPALTVKIIGHQWYWSYEIRDFNLSFDSFIIPRNSLTKDSFRNLETDNYVCIPINRSIRLLITSQDVIHSWSVLSIGVKVDAIPGRLNQTFLFGRRPGLFFGQCSEICGANHRFMPIIIEFNNWKNFFKWLKSL